MNNMAFQDAANQLDAQLDRKLAALRARQDLGDITIRQAADLRVAVLTEHLAAVAALRVEHFGDVDAGWNSGTCST
jgi:hypothetical protein